MKSVSMKRYAPLAMAVFGLATAGAVNAAGIATNPDPASILVGGTTDVTVEFTGDGATTAFSGAIEYDTTQFDASAVAVGDALCNVNDAFTATEGRVAIVKSSLSALGSQTLCTITFTSTGVTEASYPLTWVTPVFGGSGGGDTVDNGQLDVTVAPPTTQTVTASGNAGGTVSPASQDVASGSTAVVTIDPDPGFQVASIGGTCGGSPDVAPPTTSTVTYTTDPVGTAGDPDNSADCTVTATFESIPAPIYSSTPAPGSTLNCASGGSTSVTIENTGDADLTNLSCALGGVDFTASAAAATLAPGATTTVSITCPTVADGDPPVTDTLTCSSDAGGGTYPLSASAIPPVPPAIPTPELVPASSLWSKLMLFGFLAGLGALVISLRRS